MEQHNYMESLSVSTVEYNQWYQSSISKLRLQEDLAPIVQPDEVLRSNYFNDNQYFNETSSTQSSANGSREYQKLLASEKLPSFWDVPYTRNPNFHGREEEVEILVDKILNTATSMRIILYGPRWSDKVEMAKELAYRVSSDNPEHTVWWIQSDDIKTTAQYFCRIGEQLQIDTPEINHNSRKWLNNSRDIENQVWQHLAGDSIGPWLMIFEDVGSDFMEFRPDTASATTDDKPFTRCEIPSRSRSCIVFITSDKDFPGLHDGSAIVVNLSPLQDRNSDNIAQISKSRDLEESDTVAYNPSPRTSNSVDLLDEPTINAEQLSFATAASNSATSRRLSTHSRAPSAPTSSQKTSEIEDQVEEAPPISRASSLFEEIDASAIPSNGLALIYKPRSPIME